jgi:hypothetical protein
LAIKPSKAANSTPAPAPIPQPVSAFTGELPPPAEGRWLVAGSNTSGRPDVFPTLTAALAKAGPGQTVAVYAPQLEEAVTINSRLEGIHIETGLPGLIVVWRPPADASADVPLLRLDSAGAAVIKGFTFDGADRLNKLVEITGQNAGLRLEDLYLTDAGKRAIVMAGAVAAKDRPITLERVRVTTVREYAAAMNQKSTAANRPSAVECSGAGSSDPLNLVIRWCRFEGVFMEAVLFQCPVDATLEFNRFGTLKPDERSTVSQLIKAVSVRGVPPSAHVHVTIANNTMAQFTHLLRIDKLTPSETDYRFVVRNNLVLGERADAWVFVNSQTSAAVAKPIFEGSGGNVCRPGTLGFAKQLPDSVVPRTQLAFGDLDTAAGTDDFLRYPKTGDTAALLTAGADGGPVGVPPLE